MIFRFQEGDTVVLRSGEGYSSFLTTGSRGVVFCRYLSDPPAYEVNFQDGAGQEFGLVVYEADIEMVREMPLLSPREAARAN